EAAVQEIIQFYRNFHSYRYVRDKLVIRMNRPLPPELVARMNEDFGDIIEEGIIEQIGALPEEADDVPEKPRLYMQFNRRSHGRLRKIIDLINTVSVSGPVDVAPPVIPAATAV